MSESESSLAVLVANAAPTVAMPSAWSPFREPLFRNLWFASVISYTGTWMQNIGTGWLMTSLTTSPMMIGLVQAAMSLPVFLVVLPAGALADMVDRRKLLIAAQIWMMAAAALLGILTVLQLVTPMILLVLTFVLGFGAVMNDPAWQAITPDVVSPQRFASAVALNSAGFNVARAIGPAIGGLVIAVAGSGPAFLLNAASFVGVIAFSTDGNRSRTLNPFPRRASWNTFARESRT
ncbi:MAG: arabinose efflux permease family protein [Acidobacteriales bacterium]|nr:arabinose efflux permease family protein [Terriglobales bacterium]